MSKHLYLAKANNKLISHCSCSAALVTYPPQVDCPWCGCGRLFTCMECRKAFIFARAIETDWSWQELARRDLTNKWNKRPSRADVRDWVEAMRVLTKDLVLGQEYVYLDGYILPLDAQGTFDGWAARHEFDVLPQVAALDDPQILASTVGSKSYWLERRIE